jgi:hypothetical protein
MVWVALWVFYAVVVDWAWVGTPIAGAVLLVAVVAAQGWVAMTLLRMGVYVYDDHLLIRSNTGRTTTVAWVPAREAEAVRRPAELDRGSIATVRGRCHGVDTHPAR